MDATGKVFTKSAKVKCGCLSVLFQNVWILLPPIVGLIVVFKVLPQGARDAAVAPILVLSFFFGLLLSVVAFYVMPRWYNRVWRRELAEKILQREGLTVDNYAVQFVGWSPGNKLGQWEGDTDRDLGFLLFGPEWVTYLGDEFRFSLRREWVWLLDQSIGSGPLLMARRVLVGHIWPDGYQHFCNFESRENRTAWGLKRDNQRIAELLRAWHQGAAFQSAPPPPFVEFGPPERL